MKILTASEVVQAIQDGKKVEFRYPNIDVWHKIETWKNLSLGKLLDPTFKFRLVQETLTVNDVSFPKPESEPLRDGDEYWMADPTHKRYALLFEWSGDEFHKWALSRAMVHKSKENAIAHAKCLIKLSGGTIDE